MARFARSGVNQMRAALMQTTQDVNPAYARLGAHARLMSSVGNQAPQGAGAANFVRYTVLGGIAIGCAYSYMMFTSGNPVAAPPPSAAPSKPGDYAAVRSAIADLLDAPEYDDGSYGPVLVRLAWHASGTYDRISGTGGSNGATMRFVPECEHGANAGLDVARKLLEPVKAKFPWISNADLWTLAGGVAIEEMGGPEIKWHPGRVDKPDGSHCTPDGRLPDAAQGAAHVREVFGRMGFNDQETVALIGAHSLGRCHDNRSGFLGPWTNSPTTFSNLYFKELKERTWQKKKWNGPFQYEDKESGKLMMLPADMCLLTDKKFKKWVDLYAKDEEKFAADFSAAWTKLMELGVPAPAAQAA